MDKKRLAVLVSGSGSNLQAILDASSSGKLEADVVLVASNRRNAYGLVRAAKGGVPSIYLPLRPYLDAGKTREAYDADLAIQINKFRPDLVVLAGWMHILSPAFLDRFPNQVINLHPALPGKFAGTHAIERAFDAFQQGELKGSGCMVHFAVPEVDAGAVLVQEEVPIFAADSLADFEARMHAAEHRIIVEAIRLAFRD